MPRASKKKKAPGSGPGISLKALRSDPGFLELQDIRAMCGRYMDEDGLSVKEEDDALEDTDVLPEDLGHDHFKDQEMLDRATEWARDYDGVMACLQVRSTTTRKKEKIPWPKGVPAFERPAQLIEYFKGRWEKLKCRYC